MPPRKRASRSLADDDDDDDENYSDDAGHQQPRKRTRAVANDDDDEETELGSTNTAADGDEQVDEAYDADGYGDDADRAHLASLPQLEREQIIYERQEKRRELEERKEARRRARELTGEAPELEARASRSATAKARARSSGKAIRSDALSEMAARRRGEITSKMSDTVLADEYEDEDYAVDDEPSRASAKRKSAAPVKRSKRATAQDDIDETYDADEIDQNDNEVEERQELTEEEKLRAKFSIPGSRTALKLNDLKLIQMRRDRLEKIYEEPYFSTVIEGMFVRVTVGADRHTGQAIYRVGEVMKVEEMKARYPFPPGQSTRTTKLGLRLKRGVAERLFSMAAVSNHSITDEEFTEYVEQQKKANLPVLTAEEALERKKTAEHKRDTYEYTPDIVAKMIEEKKGRGKQLNVTVERTKMEIEISRAKAQLERSRKELYSKKFAMKKESNGNDSDEDEGQGVSESVQALDGVVKAAESRLESLENKFSELQELELKQAKQSRARVDAMGIAEVNKRNAERDISEMRDMFIQQERERKQQDEEMKKQGKTRVVVLDPFKRRATRPSMHVLDEDEETKTSEPIETIVMSDDDDDDRGGRHAKKGKSETAKFEFTPHSAAIVPVTGNSHNAKRLEGPLSFPHPPSLSEQLQQSLSLAHAIQLPIEIPANDTSNLSETKSRSEFEARLKQHADASKSHWLQFTRVPGDASVLTVSEYWARRDEEQ